MLLNLPWYNASCSLTLLFLYLAIFRSLVPDVEGVCVSLRRIAVTSLKLVVELLKGSEVKATNRNSTVAFLLTDFLEVFNRILTSPAVEKLFITLTAHIDILMGSPVAASRISFLLVNLLEDLRRRCSLMQDVNGVCVALRRFAVTSLELVVKLLKGCMTKRADTDCTVALVNNHLLEILDRVLAPPVTDDFHVTLAAHIDVLMLSPVSNFGISLALAFGLSFLGLLAYFEP